MLLALLGLTLSSPRSVDFANLVHLVHHHYPLNEVPKVVHDSLEMVQKAHEEEVGRVAPRVDAMVLVVLACEPTEVLQSEKGQFA